MALKRRNCPSARRLRDQDMRSGNLKKRLKTFTTFVRDRSGGAAIVMAVAMPVVLGGLAFGSEVAFWEFEKRSLQNEADTAAFAAGTQVRSGADEDVIVAAAVYVAAESGFEGGEDNITVEYPPSTAPLAADGTNVNGDDAYVYVTLNQTIDRRFTKFFSSDDTVSFIASAIAQIESGRPACVLALHPSADGAISTGGSTNVELTGCDIAANSISSSAISANGNGSSVAAECISAVGDVSVNNTYDLVCPEPISNAPLTADPYKNVPLPTAASCTSNHTTNQFPSQGSGAVRCYTAGNNIGFSGNGSTTLTSNVTYVFKNAGASAKTFTLNGGHKLNGTNVTLVFEGVWTITVNGNSTMNITAPTTGAYKGLALVGDRNNSVDMELTGNNGNRIVGAIYSPNKNSHVQYRGSNVAYTAGQCTQVIGGTVGFTGNSDFSTDCSASGTTAIFAGQSIKIVG